MVGACATARSVVAVPRVQEDRRYVMVRPSVKSELCAPIEDGSQLLGVLNVDSTEAGFFDPDDSETIGIATTLAHHVGRILSRSSLLEDRARRQRSIVKTIETMTAATVSAGLAHEIKNRLAVVQTKLSFLPIEDLLQSDLDRRRWLELRTELDALSKMAHWLLEHVGTDQPNRSRCHINPIVAERVRTMEDLALAGNVDLVAQLDSRADAIELNIDPHQIAQAITTLILNALQASRPGLKVVVSTADRPQGWVTISVRDYGRGLTSSARKHLFDMFYTEREQGFGLGLPTVHRIVAENHDGRVRFHSRIGGGSTFRIQLPKKSAAK